MTYHILNGDALTERFLATGLTGETLVMRECLVEGDLSGNTPVEFYKSRANYLSATYGEQEHDYFTAVVPEFEKITAAPNHSTFHLWFGYDLFCRANMWYLLSLLHQLSIKKEVFVVYPSYLAGGDIWKDFGPATPQDLITCFDNKIRLTNADIQLGNDLWTAFKNSDFIQLEQLSQQSSAAFPYLAAVCKAHIERFPEADQKSRPESVIAELLDNAVTDFPSVYKAFFEREGIYGFGDSQVKNIYDKVIHNRL